MPIDIDALSEPELVDLNHRIVERLRFLHQIHAHQAMLKFSIGDRVTFEDGQGRKVEGTLTRYNRKSVTVIGADGRHWNIAPGFLRKAGSSRRLEDSEHHRASKTITSRDGVSVSMHQSRRARGCRPPHASARSRRTRRGLYLRTRRRSAGRRGNTPRAYSGSRS